MIRGNAGKDLSRLTARLLVVDASRTSGGRVKPINQLKGLILAQNERWRRGLGMQVEREFAS